MDKIEHIGIAVSSLEQSGTLYAELLNAMSYKKEDVESEKVTTEFFMVGDNKIELLQATSPDSPVAAFIAKRGEGIHHIAFAVSDIHAEMNRLRRAGFELLSDSPKKGADNKLVCFIHPKSASGVLIELCQDL
jgi:methylmalonyl-CoA/ethylmalonyl-CoA epimerase